MEEAEGKGEVDEPALGLIRKINGQKDMFTSSSCWGRIMLIDFAGEKGVSKFRGKWHRTVSFGEVKEALETAEGKQIWLRAEPLIIHVSCRNIQAAKKALEIKEKAGIKRGGIFSMTEDRIQIELEGTQRMEALVKIDGRIIVNDALLKKFVDIANNRLKKNEKDWVKIEKLFTRA